VGQGRAGDNRGGQATPEQLLRTSLNLVASSRGHPRPGRPAWGLRVRENPAPNWAATWRIAGAAAVAPAAPERINPNLRSVANSARGFSLQVIAPESVRSLGARQTAVWMRRASAPQDGKPGCGDCPPAASKLRARAENATGAHLSVGPFHSPTPCELTAVAGRILLVGQPNPPRYQRGRTGGST